MAPPAEVTRREKGGDMMNKKRQVLTLVTIAVVSFLIGTMFNFTTIVIGGKESTSPPPSA